MGDRMRIAISIGALMLGGATALSAQTRPAPPPGGKWEVEVHAGGVVGAQPTGGTGMTAFPAGQPFTSTTGRASRYASSWMFGDGSVLLNQIAASFSSIPVVARMTPLDPMLTKSSLERHAGASFGAAVSRRLTSIVTAEFSVHSAAAKTDLTSDALEAIDTTRASFAAVLNGIVATGAGVVFTGSNVSAKTTLGDGNGRQTFVTGAVRLAAPVKGMIAPYVTAGVGVVKNTGDGPTATIVGNYQFLIGNVAPINETDTVKIHFAAKDTSAVAVFGGGVNLSSSAQRGLRADVRIYVSGNSTDTLIDATPSVATGTPSGFISSSLTPAIQFSNSPSAAKSNLNTPAVTNLKTFEGSGNQVRTAFTVGYFFRF